MKLLELWKTSKEKSNEDTYFYPDSLDKNVLDNKLQDAQNTVSYISFEITKKVIDLFSMGKKCEEIDSDTPLKTSTANNKGIDKIRNIYNEWENNTNTAVGLWFTKYVKTYNRIGVGGMANIFLVEFYGQKGKKIIKTLNEATKNEYSDENEKYIQYLKNEQVSSFVPEKKSPIMRTYEVYEDGKNSLAILEYCKGENLKDILEEEEPFENNLNKFFAIAMQISKGLKAIHEITSHNDIKLENIILTEKGEIKIVDFGTANRNQLLDIAKYESVTLGSPLYLSPESIKESGSENIGFSKTSDIFSFGIVLYALLKQDFPNLPKLRNDQKLEVNDIIHKTVNGNLNKLSPSTNITPSLATLINNMLKKSPSERKFKVKNEKKELNAKNTETVLNEIYFNEYFLPFLTKRNLNNEANSIKNDNDLKSSIKFLLSGELFLSVDQTIRNSDQHKNKTEESIKGEVEKKFLEQITFYINLYESHKNGEIALINVSKDPENPDYSGVIIKSNSFLDTKLSNKNSSNEKKYGKYMGVENPRSYTLKKTASSKKVLEFLLYLETQKSCNNEKPQLTDETKQMGKTQEVKGERNFIQKNIKDKKIDLEFSDDSVHLKVSRKWAKENEAALAEVSFLAGYGKDSEDVLYYELNSSNKAKVLLKNIQAM